ncbi:hypothetical protein ACJIZ3_007373 [Penstemon smallii]|uniref:Uncharacterized protein n=1 Tax=Penstemon smallii TaxID=265156 RepID=A0ABD3SAB9_9LAMI
MATTVLELCQVAPPPNAVEEQRLPLVHFDIMFLPIVSRITLFYQLPCCSKSHFLESIIPNLKNSLSLTLKAGNIIFPLNNTGKKPIPRYVLGDSVSLTIAESNADFHHLTGDHALEADIFHAFVPPLPKPNSYDDYISIPVVSLQVTLFPNKGICIGFTNKHCIDDGATLTGFLQAWSSINKFNGDDDYLQQENYLPCYDRTTIEDPNGLDLILWNQMKMFSPTLSPTISFPTDRVQATFIVSEADIKRLKSIVLEKLPSLAHVSTFLTDDNEPEYFTFAADCRLRLKPPLPYTYFGNCVTLAKAETTHGNLKGNEGVVAAAEAISEAIHKTLYNEKGILDGVVNRLKELKELAGKRAVRVSRSPRFDLYGVDFGWGRTKKFEPVSIDPRGFFSLSKSRTIGGGVQISYSKPKIQMERFAAIFNQELRGYS